MPSFPSPAAAPVVTTAPWEGNPLKGTAAGVVLHLWLRGCCEKCTGVRKCEKEKISLVGKKGNVMGELIGLSKILNCVQRICLSVNIILN